MIRWLPLLAALLLAACSSPPPTIAVVGPDIVITAARLALEDVNRTGGIGGRPLRLVARSDRGGAQVAVQTANELSDQPAILGVVGHDGSASSLAASQVYNVAGLLQVAPSTSAPLFARAGPSSFTMVPTDARQAEFLARQLGTSPSLRIAVVHANDDYGRGLRTELRLRLVERGLAPPLEYALEVPAARAELDGLGAVLARFRPDVLLWIGQPSALASVLPGLRRALPALRVFGSDSFDDPFTYGAGRDSLRGLTFVRFVDPRAGGPRFQAFARRYHAATGLDVTCEPLFTYDAVLLMAEGMRRGGRTRAALLRQVSRLAREGFAGAEGIFRLEGQQSSGRPYLLGEVAREGVRAVATR